MGTAFPSKSAWIFLAALALIELVWLVSAGFAVTGSTFYTNLSIIAGGFLAARYCQIERPRLLFAAAAFLTATNCIVRILNYLGSAASLPLIDAELAAMDEALGFDWLAYLAFVNAHPWFAKLLEYSYQVPMALAIVLIVGLALRQEAERLREFLLLFMATVLFTVGFASMFPALDATVYYAPGPELTGNINPSAGVYHLAIVTALRDGNLFEIDFNTIEGLATFPSFHTIEGILLVWCLRNYGATFYLALVATVIMLLSTPVYGGHYLVDLIAGAVVAVVAIALYHRAAVAQKLRAWGSEYAGKGLAGEPEKAQKPS